MGYKWPLMSALVLYTLSVWGAVVVGLDAGFACPDWPLCGGHLIPSLRGGVLIEYVHRWIALIATCLIIYNAWRSWRLRRGDKWVARLSILSVLLLLLQSALGAIIVVLVLPGAFTTIDVANSLILLSVLSAMTAMGLQQRREVLVEDGSRQVPLSRFRQVKARMLVWPSVVSWAAAFLENVIGGYFRHSGDSQALFGQNTYLLSHDQHVMPALASATLWLLVHVAFLAFVVAAFVWLAVRSARLRLFRGAPMVLLALTAFQALMGVVALATKLSVLSDTVHFAGAAMLVMVASFELSSVLQEAYPRAVRLTDGLETKNRKWKQIATP